MLLLLLACPGPLAVGDLVVTENGDGGLDITRYTGKELVRDLRFAVGEGDESIAMQAGSYLVESGDSAYSALTLANRRGSDTVGIWDLVDEGNATRGLLTLSSLGTRALAVQVAGDGNRIRFDAACTGDDHFVGGGEHAFDTDHAGEAFALWVSEPGIGKSEYDSPPSDWFLTGTRHASSYPDPFFIRPEPVGVLAMGSARVEVDLCSTSRWRLDTWDSDAVWVVLDADTPLELVQEHALATGPVALPPDWAFGAWVDAVRGADRVREVAAELRDVGASVSVVWSEDWRGGAETSFGYHPRPEWAVDESLYPDPSGIDAELEATGLKWFAYFAPFLVTSSSIWEEAAEFAIQDSDGDPYLFTGPSLEDASIIDLSNPAAWDWALAKMGAARDVGFDGWMADYGEWLPTDALAYNMDVVTGHNAYPLSWQALSSAALDGHDATYFARSGWTGSPGLAPIHWPGDQRTSFDADDGLPSVLPLTLGGSIAGVPFSGSDVAGYQSIGNDPSTKELWMRWAALGAFSPIFRTHHGAFSDEDWQFDTDEATLAAFAEYSNVHARLFPYLRGLAEEAVTQGTPMVRPLFLHFASEAWSRTDAWLLGPSLLVAPVVEEGATARTVDLPAEVAWFDYWTGAPASSGSFDAPLGDIPVFAPAGAVIPEFSTAPDSLVAGPLEGITTLADADTARTVRVFGGKKGSFVEADGTTYTSDGEATGSGTATDTFASGTLTAAGLTLTISGEVERDYTLVVGG